MDYMREYARIWAEKPPNLKTGKRTSFGRTRRAKWI